jgi:broad specificity phosphatase PhoE
VTRLLLCRHVEEGNAAQAELLAATLADAPVAAVYASPLPRAVATARAVGAVHGLEPTLVPALREIELGDVAGLQFEEYPPELQTSLLSAPATVRFPGGETYEELRARMVDAVAELVERHPDDTVVAVSHAGAIRAALATWLGVPGDAAFRLDQRFGAVNAIEWLKGEPFVRLVNGARLEG